MASNTTDAQLKHFIPPRIILEISAGLFRSCFMTDLHLYRLLHSLCCVPIQCTITGVQNHKVMEYEQPAWMFSCSCWLEHWPPGPEPEIDPTASSVFRTLQGWRVSGVYGRGVYDTISSCRNHLDVNFSLHHPTLWLSPTPVPTKLLSARPCWN